MAEFPPSTIHARSPRVEQRNASHPLIISMPTLMPRGLELWLPSLPLRTVCNRLTPTLRRRVIPVTVRKALETRAWATFWHRRRPDRPPQDQ
jgi:hypothetical protein